MRSSWSELWTSRLKTNRKKRAYDKARLRLERLEDRLTLSTTVTLDAAANLVIADTGVTSNDNIFIESDTANGQFVIRDPGNTIDSDIVGATGSGTNTVLVPFASVTGGAIFVNASAGDDFLTIDLGLGNFAKTITYDGGGNGSIGDELRLQGGGTYPNVSHTFVDPATGSVAISGNALISYRGLEPVTDNLSATDRVFTFTGGAESITLFDVLGAPYMAIDSTLGEIVHFLSPTNSLTIDAGTGNDTVNMNSVDPAFAASLIIHGGVGHDIINLNADITFATNRIFEVNLQDDAAQQVGIDRIAFAANANYVLSGTGTATLRSSGGISFAPGSSLITADGVLILEGNAPGISDGTFTGVAVDGATVQSTGAGAVQIVGRGGTGGSSNYGVRLTGAAVIQSGTGPLQLLGSGGINTSGNHPGVSVEGLGALISSAGGNVRVTGIGGGAGSSSGNTGVIIRSGRITAGGAGTVTVHGTGGTTSGGPNPGVEIQNGAITSSGGNVQVTGIGGATGATNGMNIGVYIVNGSQISAGGTGTVIVHGTGSLAGGINNHGVAVTGLNSRITSNGGDIQVTGIRGAQSSTPSFGISLTSSASIAATNAANIELISDSMGIFAPVNGGFNTVTLRQLTNNAAITLGAADAAGILGLFDSELDLVTAGTLNIGNANAGPITVSGTISRPAATLMNLTTGSNIAMNGVLVDSGGVVNLNAPAGSITTPAGASPAAPDVSAATTNVDGVVAPGGTSAGEFAVAGNLAFSSTDRYRVQINGSSAGNLHDIITVSNGQASLGSATLDVVLGFTPSPGQQFLIVNMLNSISAGGSIGTFRDTLGNTLNEGSTFSANGVTFRISYVSGSDGKDVVLTALTAGLTLAISDTSVVESNAGTTTMTFNVTLSAPSTQTITVNWATANGTATTTDGDFVGANGTLTFNPGDTSEPITVTVNGDVKFEQNEILVVNLFNAVGAAIGDNQGFGTIINDDSRPTSSINDVTDLEGTFTGTIPTFVFTVTLTNPTYETVDVNYQVFDGTAVAGDYYGSGSGNLHFLPGETSKTITVNINDDDMYELDESFSVRIVSDSRAPTTDDTGVGTILNDDGQPTIRMDDLNVGEGNSGTTLLTFPVFLSNTSYLPITVNYVTADGSATVADNDYQPVSGTVTFNPGQSIVSFPILINGDTKFEANENFTVNLSNATNSTIADGVAVNTILNDDTRPTISINDISVLEGNSGTVQHFFTVSLSKASTETVSVNFATANGTALSGDNDFEHRTGTLTFTPGQTSQTLAVLVIGDTKLETDETFTVNLSAAVNATLADSSGLATILNDDSQPQLTLTIDKDWSFQTVDSAGDVGAWSSLEIGSDNNPRIAYEDRSTSSRNLKYASFDGTAWGIQTVHDAPTDIVGQGARLALDSLNRPHIAYQNFSDTDLLYAHHNGTSWLLETANVNSYLYIAVDVDSQNRPLISSFNHNTFDLNLARRQNGTWSVETPDTTNDATGYYTSLAVDSSDNPWITFVNATDQTLTLARHNGTTWQFQTIASGSDFRDTSLVLDSLGRPHVSYYDYGPGGANRDLKYAFFDGTAWTITTVDSNNAGEHNSLVLDSHGRPRIAYIGSGAARYAAFDGNSWSTQFVGAQANYTSLALDQNDLASISYYSTTTNDLVLASQVTASMNENGGSKLARVTRTDTTGALTVNLLSSDTSEATVVASVVLANGQATSAPFNINAVDDFLLDGTQTVTITASATGYLGDTDTVNVTDDDTGNPPTVTLSLSGSPLAENGGVATVTATLSALFAQTVTVDLGFAGTAAHPADYDRSGTSIVIPAGSRTGSITLTGVNDTTDEAIETIIVDIVGVTNGTEAGTQQVTAAITDDDPTPSVSINDVTFTEGNGGTTNFVFNVTLSNPSSQPITINFTTENGTATAADNDYETTAGSITFSPGQTSRSITVNVNGESKFEPDETFTVVLGGAGGSTVTIADGVGLGTIINDDSRPSISISDALATAEGNSGTTSVVFTVILSNPTSEVVTVDYTTTNGTATVADGDYVPNSGTLTFPVGVRSQTITVVINGDVQFEPNESFYVDLSNERNATILDSQGLGTINNDDTMPTISINDVTLPEGNAGTTNFVFTLSLSNPTYQTVIVTHATANGTATTSDGDYQSAGGIAIIAPGQTSQTVTVLVNGDINFEPNENFTVGLSSASGATINDSLGVGTIQNDDNLPAVSINDVTLSEGNAGTTSFGFTVSLSNPSSQTVTVSYSTNNGSATTQDGDYQSATGSVTFAPGQTSQPITVVVNGDTKFEGDETFTVELTAPSNATLADGAGVGTIRNDDNQPTISIDNISQAEGNSGTTAFVFTVSLSNPSAQAVTVDFTSANGSATLADSDFQAASGTVTFAPGQTSQPITVLVNGDTKFEQDETFAVNLSGTTNATIADGTGAGTIRNDDGQPTVSIDDVTGAEGNSGSTLFFFSVTLSNPSSLPITVDFITADGTATLANNDYQAAAGAVTFAPGQTAQSVMVTVNGDTTAETDETFNVLLSGATNATIADGTGVGTIRNDDGLPTISISDVNQMEGHTGTTAFVFTLSLSNPSAQAVSVNFATADGTATLADGDYANATGSVTFAPGTTTQSVTVLVTGDTKFEPDETFTVDLSAATNATIADGSGLGTIRNDDNQPTISINDVSQLEGNSGTTAFVFTVSLSQPSSQPVNVSFAAANGTATLADSDYQSTAGNVTFAPGTTTQTVTVLVHGDSKFEPNELFVVNLSAATNATISDGSGLGTIRNDDSQPSIRIDDVSRLEGNEETTAFVFTLTLSNPSAQAITVNYSTADGTAATANNDYQSTGETVTFAPGQTTQTITVLVNGDTQEEADETFFVMLSSPVNAAVADGQGRGTIVNDDTRDVKGTIELVGGVLTIRGTDKDDAVHINRVGSGNNAGIKVHASFLKGKSHIEFNESSISRIVILVYAGDDRVTVAGNVSLEMTIDGGTGDDDLQSGIGDSLIRGGDGNDKLEGRSGNDILVGGDGNDDLVGGQGRDLLIGGAGADSIEGGDGDDILIAGFTDHDAIDAALLDIMEEWTSNHTFPQRVDNLKNGSGGGIGGPRNGTTFLNEFTVHDDGAKDDLDGGSGTDWFLYNFTGAGVKDTANASGTETNSRLDT